MWGDGCGERVGGEDGGDDVDGCKGRKEGEEGGSVGVGGGEREGATKV